MLPAREVRFQVAGPEWPLYLAEDVRFRAGVVPNTFSLVEDPPQVHLAASGRRRRGALSHSEVANTDRRHLDLAEDYTMRGAGTITALFYDPVARRAAHRFAHPDLPP